MTCNNRTIAKVSIGFVVLLGGSWSYFTSLKPVFGQKKIEEIKCIRLKDNFMQGKIWRI